MFHTKIAPRVSFVRDGPTKQEEGARQVVVAGGGMPELECVNLATCVVWMMRTLSTPRGGDTVQETLALDQEACQHVCQQLVSSKISIVKTNSISKCGNTNR